MVYAHSVAKTRFFVVSNRYIPPPVSISFSLSSDIVCLSGIPPVNLQVVITLEEASPITARSTILHSGFELNYFPIPDTEIGDLVTTSNPFI